MTKRELRLLNYIKTHTGLESNIDIVKFYVEVEKFLYKLHFCSNCGHSYLIDGELDPGVYIDPSLNELWNTGKHSCEYENL